MNREAITQHEIEINKRVLKIFYTFSVLYSILLISPISTFCKVLIISFGLISTILLRAIEKKCINIRHIFLIIMLYKLFDF
ncbi:MAG TPA: hypothetical protein DG753_07470 [Clostridium sp.]|nr:hypothetical protein [Clostridium sp.]